MPAPEVSIAMVGHEHRNYLDRALSSIYASKTERSFEVVFVDNDSGDGSAEYVEREFPQVHLIRNDRRWGLARNNNLAFSATTGRLFLILNPDTAVSEGAIDRLAQHLDDNPGTGLVGPKLVFPDGRLQLSCRRFPTLRSFVWRRTPVRLLLPEDRRDEKHLMADTHHDQPITVDWLLGAALMVRRELYEELGGMDERFELYCEDIDLCFRIHEAGYDVRYLPEAAVIHDHRAETDKTFLTRRTISHYKSMLRYLMRHGIGLA